MSFFSKLNTAIQTNDSLLCVGLDPQQDMLPEGKNIEESLFSWGKRIITQTSDLVCCYKPNFAFYEQFGLEGLRALQKTLAEIPDSLPVLLDVKRGDIGSTANALATAAYDQWGADAVTLSPYLGEDSINHFLHLTRKLCLSCVTRQTHLLSKFNSMVFLRSLSILRKSHKIGEPLTRLAW